MTDAEARERMDEITRPEKPFNRFRWTITVALLVLFFGTSLTVDISPSALLALPERTLFYLGLMFLPPDLSEVGRSFNAMVQSLGMAWIGTIIGAVLSFPLAFLAATNLASKPVVFAARQILNFFRAVPEIVFLILLLPITGLTPVTVALALGISSIGTLGKLSAEVIESIDPGPVEAAAATGGGRLQRIRWAVVPQVIPEIVALWLYRFEINIRNSAVAGAVGAGGIGTLLVREIQLLRNWATAGTALAVMVIVTLIVDTISGRVRRRIIRGPQRPVDIGADTLPPDADRDAGPDLPNDPGEAGPRTFAPI
ncbi:MAG: phosphonate ABC transporter, permease protein PhnE [Nitriliruptoraceae bacterium]|nr:phosphonate ABC transporter, permease protein PhnE [Nitriliruptoraceae bacterium]